MEKVGIVEPSAPMALPADRFEALPEAVVFIPMQDDPAFLGAMEKWKKDGMTMKGTTNEIKHVGFCAVFQSTMLSTQPAGSLESTEHYKLTCCIACPCFCCPKDDCPCFIPFSDTTYKIMMSADYTSYTTTGSDGSTASGILISVDVPRGLATYEEKGVNGQGQPETSRITYDWRNETKTYNTTAPDGLPFSLTMRKVPSAMSKDAPVNLTLER